MRKKIIIGNWKMNKNAKDVINFFIEFNEKHVNLKLRDNIIYGLAIPTINIAIASNLKTKNLVISSQDISVHEKGAYTGEISAQMLLSFDVKYSIIGHSEQRMYHNESNNIVNAKAKQALKNNITPIVCVGETLEEYEKNMSEEVVKKQIEESLKNIDSEKVVIAYEPIWAIGTGKTATLKYAQKMCAFIRNLTSEKTLIQYGGSVSEKNIDQLLEQKDIDGVLVGKASLEVDSFVKLISIKN